MMTLILPRRLGLFMNFEEKANKLLVKGLSKATKSSVRESLKKYGEPLGIFQLSLNDWSVSATSQTGSYNKTFQSRT